jgi:hypothetical protein
MIIELDGDVETIDTDAASPEELVEALIKLKKAYDWLNGAFDRRNAGITEIGLDHADGMKKAPVVMVDPAKVFAWVTRAHAEFAVEQNDQRREAKIAELEDDDG